VCTFIHSGVRRVHACSAFEIVMCKFPVLTFKLKLIDRLRATRWTPPDYGQTGLVMVIRNYHIGWTQQLSPNIDLLRPLVQTKERKQFSPFDLDLWPTTLTYNPRLAEVKVDPHAKNQSQRSNGSNRRVPTANGHTRRPTHLHGRYTKRIISPATQSINI